MFKLHSTEMRKFLTSVANHKTEHINGDRYISTGIHPITQCGLLIQEGSDNIGINAETVDGKNTFHSLARAVFQFKFVDELSVCTECIKRGRDRSLYIDDTTASPMLYTSPSQNLE